jgi:hypothetical protein
MPTMQKNNIPTQLFCKARTLHWCFKLIFFIYETSRNWHSWAEYEALNSLERYWSSTPPASKVPTICKRTTETPPPGRCRGITVGSDYGGCHARQLKYGTHVGWSTCFGRSLLIMSLLWIDTRVVFVDKFNSLLTDISCSATQVACFASLACLINNQVASWKCELKVTCKLKFVFW